MREHGETETTVKKGNILAPCTFKNSCTSMLNIFHKWGHGFCGRKSSLKMLDLDGDF